jgi:hypothetical protein
VIAAGICNARQIQYGLNPAVLARAPVQRQKYDVGVAKIMGRRGQRHRAAAHACDLRIRRRQRIHRGGE